MEAQNGDLSGGGLVEALDTGQQRGLAGAVGADDAEDLTIGDLEADVVDGGQAAEATGDVGAGDGVHRDSWLMVSVEVDRLSGREGSARPRISYDHTV